jgi:hypothetical protein
MIESLQEIGKRHGTDKHNSDHSYGGSTYLDIYDNYLSRWRDTPIKMLEIGIRDGCSHRMWRDYFPKGTIYGIDIDPRCKQSQSDRIRVFIGSQADPSVVGAAVEDAGGQFDLILDDGSHVNELTLKSFSLLFPRLAAGGLYIIEDLGCSYLGGDLATHVRVGGWPGMQYNTDVEMVNDRSSMDRFFNGIIRDIDTSDTSGGRMGIEWIHFYSRIAVIKKMGRR